MTLEVIPKAKAGGRRGRLFVVHGYEDGAPTGKVYYWFKCPACKIHHAFETPKFDFDGNFAKPTFSPKLANAECVLWLQQGLITYASTSSHLMVGKVVPLPAVGLG